MDIDALYSAIDAAIWKAERLVEARSPEARAALAQVSELEERIALVLPPEDPEGMIARRGALRAALQAGTIGRALRLYEHYIREAGVTDAGKASLQDVLDGNETSGGAGAPLEGFRRETQKLNGIGEVLSAL